VARQFICHSKSDEPPLTFFHYEVILVQVSSRFEKTLTVRSCGVFLLVAASIAISSVPAVAQDQITAGCWEKPVRGIRLSGQASRLLSSEFELPELRSWCSTPGSQPVTNHCGHSTRGCCCHSNIGVSKRVVLSFNR